jgi:hypothetical protein
MKKKVYSKLKTVRLLGHYYDSNIENDDSRQEWEESVYHLPEEVINSSWWREIRTAIFMRDHYRCYRCETKRRRGLSVHHIMSRADGGEDNPENLITLCLECHDIVELAECKTLADIDATIDEEVLLRRQPKEKEKPIIDRSEDFERPAWHAWVYGSARSPR